MMSPTLFELERVCQKPRWREAGSLLARRFARPLALYLTWLVVRTRFSANVVTAIALVLGLCAAVLLALPAPAAFVAGAAVLVAWYVLDHVDGQVARFRRSASVTGVYFDFMMHHIVHPAVAFGLGFGVASRTGELAWTLAGASFALGLMLLSFTNDCRYKAFFAALRGHDRCVIGKEEAEMKIEERRTKNEERPSFFILRSSFFVPFVRACRVACEIPSVIVAVAALAIFVSVRPSMGLPAVAGYIAAMACLAPTLAAMHLAKQVWRREPDDEYREVLHQFRDEGTP